MALKTFSKNIEGRRKKSEEGSLHSSKVLIKRMGVSHFYPILMRGQQKICALKSDYLNLFPCNNMEKNYCRILVFLTARKK